MDLAVVLTIVFVPDDSESDEAYHNAGGGFGGVPASSKAVAGLKRHKHGDDDDDDDDVAVSGQAKRRRRRRATGGGESTTDEEAAAATACAICLEDFEAGDGLAVMPCAHRFHDGCLTEWLALSRLCPCCRHALPNEAAAEAEAPPAVSIHAAATSSAESGDAGATGGLQGRARHAATRRRSGRTRQVNVRLFGPEWAAAASDNGLGLPQ